MPPESRITPPEAVQDLPESSSPPPPMDPPRPAASLGTLPYELKEIIVDHLLRTIEEENVRGNSSESCEVGFFHRRECERNTIEYSAYEKKENLRVLCLLDQDFSAIALALLYKSINLHWRKSSALEYFVAEISERQASHVRSIKANPGKQQINTPSHPRWGGGRGGSRGRGGPRSDPEGQRSQLIGDVLRCCSSAIELDIMAGLGGKHSSGPQLERERAALASIADTAKNLGSALEILSIEYTDVRAAHVSFFGPSTSITSLSVVYFEGTNATDFAMTSAGLLVLPELKHLRLRARGLINDDFLLAPPPLPLESLELEDSDFSGTFVSLHAFISAFAGTLTSLGVDLAGFNQSDVWPVPRDLEFTLPHLAYLAISSRFDSTFFLRFAPTTPLILLRLGRLARDEHTLDRLRSLLATRSLERMHLAKEAQQEGLGRLGAFGLYRGGLSELDVDDLEDACSAHGIVLSGVVRMYQDRYTRYGGDTGYNTPDY